MGGNARFLSYANSIWSLTQGNCAKDLGTIQILYFQLNDRRILDIIVTVPFSEFCSSGVMWKLEQCASIGKLHKLGHFVVFVQLIPGQMWAYISCKTTKQD